MHKHAIEWLDGNMHFWIKIIEIIMNIRPLQISVLNSGY